MAISTILDINPPNLTATATTTGLKGGVPGGTTTTPGGSTAIPGSPAFNAQGTSPKSLLQQRWRPGSLIDTFKQLATDRAPQAARDLDKAIQQTYTNTYTLEKMIACRQDGSATVTGSITAIPTGLKSVTNVTVVVDNGATAHNLWPSARPSAIPGAIDIFVWKPTANNDNTPIAATSPILIRWSAVGSL